MCIRGLDEDWLASDHGGGRDAVAAAKAGVTPATIAGVFLRNQLGRNLWGACDVRQQRRGDAQAGTKDGKICHNREPHRACWQTFAEMFCMKSTPSTIERWNVGYLTQSEPM